jgi:cell pole-organizing protein PopZ
VSARGKEAPGPARSAPPAPRMLGDLGSVVPGRFDSQIESATQRIGAPMADPSDRFSPVGAPAPRPTPAPPARPETARAAPVIVPAPEFESEIPGADALRRLIAGVVPPSALASPAPARAPAPNADDIRTEVVLPAPAKAPEAVTVADSSPRPAAPAANRVEPVPAAKPAEPVVVAKPMDAAPRPQTKPSEAAPAAATPAPVQQAPTPAASATAPAPAADSVPKQAPLKTPPVTTVPAARTMDETVVELLRPLLRDWLDTNMPRLIEPALKAELEALRGVVAKDKKD